MTSRRSKHPDWDELWEKVRNRDWDWLEDYTKSHDINQCTDEQGNTLLHCAVRDKNQYVIAHLSDFFIDPNIKNAAGQTALQLAQDAKCLGTLHDHLCIDFAKASLEPNGLDALFAAIYRGDATLGNTSGVKNNGNEVNAGGWTALHCAVIYDRPHLIRELHQHFPKLDADCLNCDKCSALHLAIMRSHPNCIIALRECFPAINAGDALHVACMYNHPACIPTLRKYFPQLTGNELTNNYLCSSALMRAAFHNNPECICALRSCFPDIDPNLQDDYGDTALMHACQRGSLQSITSLATYFPSTGVNMRNCQGETALMLAINRNEKCLMTLCESFPNIDPTIQDKSGQTALMVAVFTRNPGPIISQLLKSFPNIDPNVQDKGQDTALMYLLKSLNCTVESVSHFLDTFPNVDVNIQNAQSGTTLTIAIEQGKAPIVDLLLERFPDIISLTNSAGQTALMLEIKKPRINSISMLLKHIAQMQ